MNFLLFGYGSIGKKHTAILRNLGHTVITVDPDPTARANYQSWNNRGMAAHLVSSGKHLTVTEDAFDGVLDCTPVNVRCGHRANTGRALFCEKPLGDVPSPYYKPVQVGFCYHYAPGLSDFVKFVQESTIYSLAIIGGQWLPDWSATDYRQRYHGIPGQGGVILDSLPHSLYIARWILGELNLVGSVTGKLSDLEIETEDTAAVLLESENGTPCYLLADYLRQPRAFWIEAVCSDGWRRWEFYAKDAQWMYERQMQNLVALCNGGLMGVYPNLADGVAVEGVLDAIKTK